ncbi:methyl-accepting chemotaxis protein [Pseudomonas sichuanensis]|uniref:methyl-accepting chemotaxis protein n=1 Tax=Pseudomonas sichuanensis TaxID=2213015 RepID=UPI0035A60C00
MLGPLNRMLGHLSVRLKLAMGFALVLLLTLLTTLTGWQALGDAIDRSEKLSQIAQLNELSKDLRAERITFRVLSDDQSRTQLAQTIKQLETLIETMRPRYLSPENVRLIAEKRDLVERYRADFEKLQQAVATRQQHHTALQHQESEQDQHISALQGELVKRLSQLDQPAAQGQALTLIDTLNRHVEMANQRAAIPAYYSDPLQAFEEVGQPAMDAAQATLGQLDQLVRRLGLDERLSAPVAAGLARYREQLRQYALSDRRGVAAERDGAAGRPDHHQQPRTQRQSDRPARRTSAGLTQPDDQRRPAGPVDRRLGGLADQPADHRAAETDLASGRTYRQRRLEPDRRRHPQRRPWATAGQHAHHDPEPA